MDGGCTDAATMMLMAFLHNSLLAWTCWSLKLDKKTNRRVGLYDFLFEDDVKHLC